MNKILLTAVFMLILGSMPAYPFAIKELSIHGFASTGYLRSDENNYLVQSDEGSFEFNEFGINFATAITDNIRIGAQLYAYDLGDLGNNNEKLDWAFLDYSWKEYLGVRVGKIKTPYGLYNEIQDYDMLRSSILLPQSIYTLYFRETIISIQGMGLYGKTSLWEIGRIDYDAFVGTLAIDSDGTLAKYLDKVAGITINSATNRYAAGGRLKYHTPVKGLLFAFTGVCYEMDMDAVQPLSGMPVEWSMLNAQSIICSTEYSVGGFLLAAEYMTARNDQIIKTGNFPESRDRLQREGYYGQISYQLTDKFEAGTYYSVYYEDKADRNGKKRAATPGNKDYYAWQKDLAVSTSYDINEWWVVKFEVHFMDGGAHVYTITNPLDCDHRYWNLYAIKTSFNF